MVRVLVSSCCSTFYLFLKSSFIGLFYLVLISVVRVSITGKCPRTEAGNFSRSTGDRVETVALVVPTFVLSPTPASGLVRPPSPSPPERQVSPSWAGASIPSRSQGAPSWAEIPVLSLLPTEPVVVSSGVGSHGVGCSVRSEPVFAHPALVA